MALRYSGEEFGQTYTYDAENNLISVTDAQKNRQKFEYNATGDVTGITDPKGNNFKYEYDAKRRLRTATSAERVRYRLKYDTKGNIVESGCISAADTTETKGTWVARKFTEKKNHVAGVTDTEGNTVSYEWDETTDLLKSLTDGRGNKISYRYDAAQRLSAVSQKVTIGNVQKTVTNAYTYKNDRLASISHNGFAYGFTYDAFGNMLRASIDKKETDAEYSHELVRYEYEEKNGNLAKTIYSNGDYIRYEYDSMDRIQMSYYHSASASAEKRMNHYVYDRSGNLAKVQAYLAGKTYDLEYDFLDRLMRVTDESGQRYQYFYDANNNMTELRVYSDEYGTKTNYSYDKDSRETKTKIMSGKERTVTYDSCGRVAKTEWNTTNPLTLTYGYYSPDKQVGTLPRKITVGSRTLSYTYDANGNITAITDTKGSSTVKESYVYDELNRLIRENSQTQKKTFTYEYDLGGNLVKVCEYPYTTGTLPTKPSATETGTFGQVWRDKLMKWNGVVMQYDSIGNMTKKGNTTFTWTQGRKLESVNNGKKIRYYYDHAGNRVKKTVDNVTTEYCMAGDLLVTEKGEGRRIWYYYDSAANPVSMRVSGKDYFYVRNLQNDVIALIDDTGETVVEYKYNSWGKILSITGSKAGTIGKTNPFRYRGYYYDEETGMYYLKNRYYDPEIRRFISADSYISGFNSTMCNVFCYCGNNPVSNSDPEGTFFKKIVHFLKSKWKKTKKAVAKVYNFVREHVATFVGTESYQTSKVDEVLVDGVVKVTQTISTRNTSHNSEMVTVYANHVNGKSFEWGYSMDVGVVHSGTSINQGTLTQSLSIGKKKTIGGSVGLNNKGSLIVATDYTVTSDKSETTTEISVEISWMVLAAALGCLLIPELMVAMPAFVKFMA